MPCNIPPNAQVHWFEQSAARGGLEVPFVLARALHAFSARLPTSEFGPQPSPDGRS